MKSAYCVGLDAHSVETEIAVVTPSGRLRERRRVATTIPDISEVIAAVPKPRRLVLEESTLADWLWRNLTNLADEVVVCDPRHNRSIGEAEDKDDKRDALALAQLLRGGYVKAVHHPESQGRITFKVQVGMYHDRVRQRVRESNRIGGVLRRFGVMACEKDFATEEARSLLLSRLPAESMLHADLKLAWSGYDVVASQVKEYRRRLTERSGHEEVLHRWRELPGIGWVRAATLFVHLDTPWRFKSKSALWKYLGIGLRRRQSGEKAGRVSSPTQFNRLLKTTILGAARRAIVADDNPFAGQYARWLHTGLTPVIARRNVARSLACTLWGMWKSGQGYRPEWVGVNVTNGRA